MREEEIWKDIEGFEGLYQVSNMGRIKSLGNGKSGNSKERILKLRKNTYGYLQVVLSKDGKSKNYLVHRLVAEVFLDNPEGYNEVNHINEDKSDNRADNLEFCSGSYNCNYGTRNKRIAEKLTNHPDKSKPVIGIERITGLIVEFPSTMEAERQLGISNGNICNCLKGRYKSAGGYVWYYSNADAE